MAQLTRAAYAALYGPTTGDRVRLADTDLWIEVEEDRCFGGDEAVFGGGKSIRESMAQSTASRADGAPDLVITNAVVLDHWGVVKTDVGIRDGRIVALGRSGNPDISDGVHPDLVIGPGTDVISGEGRILTAGAVDTHVHFLMPETLHEALATGTTTVIGGGTGATEGSKATTVTPGAFNLAMMHRSLDRVPLNVMLFAKGSTVGEDALREAALDGAAATRSTRTGAPPPPRSTPRSGRPTPTDSKWPCTRTASTRSATSKEPSTPSPDAASTSSTPRGRAAATPPTSSPSPPTPTSSRRQPTRRSRTPSTPSPNTSTCSWCATTSTPASPRTSRSPNPGSAPPPSPPRTCCTTSARSPSPPPTPRRWAASARSSAAPGRSPTS